MPLVPTASLYSFQLSHFDQPIILPEQIEGPLRLFQMPSWLQFDNLLELPDDVLRRSGRFADPAIPLDYEISPRIGWIEYAQS